MNFSILKKIKNLYFNPTVTYLDKLNKKQIEAVTSVKGFIRVIAGPGAGKTKVLTHRAVYLIKEMGVNPYEILSVTFTNKAAFEMKSRIADLIGNSTSLRTQTFHGFCNTLLREEIHVLRYPKSFIIIDEEDQKSIIKDILSSNNMSLKDISFKKCKDIISLRKTNEQYIKILYSSLPIDDSLPKSSDKDDIEEWIFLSYLKHQRQNFCLDFEDLINFAYYILNNFQNIAEKWQDRIKYIQVDEFQDVNKKQMGIALILSKKHKNLFIVGDPDQTIYEWRGANVNLFIDFPADKTIVLTKNYRSSVEIINCSNQLIKNNKKRIEKEISAIRKKIEPISFLQSSTHGEQAKWIADNIQGLIKKGYNYCDIAILCRSLYITRALEEFFIRKSIPYHIYNGVDFYLRKEIKDILAFLKLALMEDNISFERIINTPPRGFGKKRIDKIKELAKNSQKSFFETLCAHINEPLFNVAQSFIDVIKHIKFMESNNVTVSEIIDYILCETGYDEMIRNDCDEKRMENIQELKNSIKMQEKEDEDFSLAEYLKNVALFTDPDKKEDENCVKIMTIHDAKGLEFPCVFVASLNEGILPTNHAILNEEIEQERRVAYVAFTRAQNMLFLSTDCTMVNDTYTNVPSRFLTEIGITTKKSANAFDQFVNKNIIES